jgi:hypothetical protein
MAHQDPIALWLMTSLAAGLVAHLVIAALSRRNYRRLRAAYVGAVAEAQETGAAGALVQAQELHRQFMRASPQSWITGLGVHVRNAFVLCAIAGVALMIAMGRLPPAIVGVALLFAIGLRRILLATALLLAVFAVTSLASGPSRRAERPSISRAQLHRDRHTPASSGQPR